MNYYIVDCNNKNIEFKFDNIILDDNIPISENRFKSIIYYSEIIDGKKYLKDLYIKTPKIRLEYDLANNKFNQLKLKLFNKYNNNFNFIKFIDELQNNITERKKYKNKKLEFTNIFTKEKNTTYIKLYFNENLKITSDNNKNYNISDLRANCEIQLVFKLTHLWENDIKYGLSANICQIHYYAPIHEHQLNFFNQIPNIIQPPILITNKPDIIKPPSLSSSQQQQQQEEISKPKLFIDSNMLKSIKLKPVK